MPGSLTNKLIWRARAGLEMLFANGDLRSFFLSVGPTGASAVLQLCVFVITARTLGPEQFGLIAVLYAVSVISTDIAGLGSDGAMLKSVSVRRKRFRFAWGHFLTVFGASVLPIALTAASVGHLLTGLSVGWLPILALIAGEVIIGRVTAASELAFVSHDKPVQASLVRLFTVGCRTFAAIIAFVVMGWDTIESWSIVTLIQSMFCACLLTIFISRTFGKPRMCLIRRDLTFGTLMMLNQVARSLNNNFDRIVLAAFLAPAQLGVYASATRLLQVNGILNQAATRIFYARFFRASAKGRQELVEYTNSTGKKMALVGLGGTIVMIILAQLLPLLLGEGYEQSMWIAVCLALISPVISLQYPPADALTASDKQLLRTIVYFVMALVSGCLIAFGAIAWGIFGAVAGMAASQFILTAVLWFLVKFAEP